MQMNTASHCYVRPWAKPGGYHRRKKPRQQKLRCSRRATATIVQHQTTRAIHGELNRPGRCGDSGAPRVSRLGSQFAAQH